MAGELIGTIVTRQSEGFPDDGGDWSTRAAAQQPDWPDPWLAGRVRADLAGMPPLVDESEVLLLRDLLAEVAHGERQVLQAGDCAEDPADCHAPAVERKVRHIESLAESMERTSGTPVLRVGRIGGQFAKPRSAPVQRHGSLELPAYRGPMVNDVSPTPQARRPDPLRMLDCRRAAWVVVDTLRAQSPAPGFGPGSVWTSHEALVLDYEAAGLRTTGSGRVLSSTHWPWIGDRTRMPDGAHVAMLASVVNPVACKVGPSIGPAELVELCSRLDPYRVAGRLTLIARMGARRVDESLPPLLAAVRAAGHPVVWLCDPLHGNTVSAHGRKRRTMTSVLAEVAGFGAVTAAAGIVAGGLHLECTPDDVDECIADDAALAQPRDGVYSTLCDPRLNPEQADAVVAAWGRWSLRRSR